MKRAGRACFVQSAEAVVRSAEVACRGATAECPAACLVPLPSTHPPHLPRPACCFRRCLLQIGAEYGAGRMLTGEVKGLLVDVLVELVERHKAARAAVSEDVVDAFMAVRPMTDLFG